MLKTMQERNDDLEREVERFHQRREIEQRVSSLAFYRYFLFSLVIDTFLHYYHFGIDRSKTSSFSSRYKR